MKFIILNILLVCEVCAIYISEFAYPNVGSVIFDKNDLKRPLWTDYEMKLLRARKHFQTILPPCHHIKNINETYLDYLMTYFKDSYKAVKRDVKDSHLQYLMDKALDDVFGGYLKVWILPLTKYGYYGGSISKETAIEMFQLYDKIKTNLNTDGRNWRSTNHNLLKSVTVDINSRPRTTFTRSMGDPCKPLALYEKSNNELEIPLPIVNWNVQPPSLVLPLKNKSFISLSAPDSPNVILHYFDIAENCIKTQYIQQLEDFHEKFQVWLSGNIMPHLSDDDLYLGLGSILSLVNATKKFSEKVYTASKSKYEIIKNKLCTMEALGQISIKKCLIIGIIIIIEIIWCVPSILYVLRIKKRKKNEGFKKCCFKFFKRAPTFNVRESAEDNRFEDYGSGVQLLLRPKNKRTVGNSQFCSFDSTCLLTCKDKMHERNLSSENIALINEISKNSSSKTDYKLQCISVRDTSNFKISSGTVCNNGLSNNAIVNQTKKMSSLTEYNLSTPESDELTIKEINYSLDDFLIKSGNELACSRCKASKNISETSQARCFCTLYVKDTNNDEKSFIINKEIQSKFSIQKQNASQSLILPQTIQKRFITPKRQSKISKISATKPTLNSKMKKSTESRLDIANIKVAPVESRKPSKIPRLTIKANVNEINPNMQIAVINSSLKTTTKKAVVGKKSVKMMKNVLDDSAIKRSSEETKKLNVTL